MANTVKLRQDARKAIEMALEQPVGIRIYTNQPPYVRRIVNDERKRMEDEGREDVAGLMVSQPNSTEWQDEVWVVQGYAMKKVVEGETEEEEESDADEE